MSHQGTLPAAWLLAACGLATCVLTTACGTRAPGRPPADSQWVAPGKILDFGLLYADNCAGCHGQDGKGGAAIGLNDPVYLAIADDATIRRVTADGVPGTAMPAFAQHSGGMLTDDQINAIVGGIRTRWAKPVFCPVRMLCLTRRRLPAIPSAAPLCTGFTARRVTARTAAEASAPVPSWMVRILRW